MRRWGKEAAGVVSADTWNAQREERARLKRNVRSRKFSVDAISPEIASAPASTRRLCGLLGRLGGPWGVFVTVVMEFSLLAAAAAPVARSGGFWGAWRAAACCRHWMLSAFSG
jgi:hypothetical protein